MHSGLKKFKAFAGELVEFPVSASWAACFEVVRNCRPGPCAVCACAHVSGAGEATAARMLFGRFLFHTSIPHASHKLATISRRNTAGWAGCYYVFTQNWSIGFQRWISASFWDVPVRPDGGFNLVQARPMELKKAFTST